MKVLRIVLLTACLAALSLSAALERHVVYDLRSWGEEEPRPEAVVAPFEYIESCTVDLYLTENDKLWDRYSLQAVESEVKACPT